jgi:adenosylcobinamide-GDP ribazoletransferase
LEVAPVGVISAVKALLALFTIIPVRVCGEEVRELSRSFWLTPLIGLFFASSAIAVYVGAKAVLADIVSIPLMVFLLHVLNRFLHLDGLADFADALIAIGPKTERIRAMRDAGVGVGGVSAILFHSILLVSALYTLKGPTLIWSLYLAEVASRNSMVVCTAHGKPASDGLGKVFVENSSLRTALSSSIFTLMLILPLAVTADYVGLEIIAIILAESCIVGYLTSATAMKILGCVTGDVIGASNELSRLTIYLSLAAIYAAR